MKRPFSGPSRALNIINSVILVGGAVVALQIGRAQVFQRAGVLIVAVTGLFVVTQVLGEIRMERLLAESAAEDAQRASQLPAIARLAERIKRNDDEQRASKARQARLTLVVLIALWLSVGELVSGFGDLAFKVMHGGDPSHAAAASDTERARSPSLAGATPAATGVRSTPEATRLRASDHRRVGP